MITVQYHLIEFIFCYGKWQMLVCCKGC